MNLGDSVTEHIFSQQPCELFTVSVTVMALEGRYTKHTVEYAVP